MPPKYRSKKTYSRRTTSRYQYNWYHYVPSALWKMGTAAVSTWIAKTYGPIAASLFAGASSGLEPTWFPTELFPSNQDFHPYTTRLETLHEDDFEHLRGHDFSDVPYGYQYEDSYSDLPDVY